MALSAEPGMKVSVDDASETNDGDTALEGSSSPTLKVLGVLVGVTVVLGGVWIGFGDQLIRLIAGEDGDVPVIAADPAPVKVRPESPGGMQVPNQGRLVYGVVDGSAAQPRVERLLPSPEKPIAVEEVLKRPVPETDAVVTGNAPRGTADMAAGPADSSAPVRLLPESSAPPRMPSADEMKTMFAPSPPPAPVAESAPTPPAPPAAPVETANAPATTVTTKAQPAPPAPKPATTARATPAPEAPTTKLKQSFRVQLAAARSEGAVVSEWDRLRRRHVDLLGDLRLEVERIDLGATKGVFYRLRIGPLDSLTAAKTLCERLKQRKLGCLVVKPGA